MSQTFGEFFKEMRIKKGLSLRSFCHQFKLDPGNMSRLERGMMAPPQDMITLKKYAGYLDIKPESEEWHKFIDLAAIGSGRIPQDILTEKDVLNRLPVVFRTLRRKKLTKKELTSLIEKLKKA